MQDPIIIVGCARSGTSLTAGIINHCGAWMGNVIGPGTGNERGFFENRELRDQITKASLIASGADPMGIASFPPTDYRPRQLRARVQRIVEDQGLHNGITWAWKTIKFVPMWRALHEAFPAARWLLCWRSPTDIADSCMRTPFMQEHGKTREFWYKWALQYHIWMAEIAEVCDTTYVMTDRLVRDTNEIELLRQFVRQSGLTWNASKVRDFIDPRLWKRGVA